jgi:hypothetical protein
MTWGVKNEGKVVAAGSREFKVRFYLDRRSINEAEKRFKSLAKGQEVEVVDFELPVSLKSGEHTLEMVIDSGKVVKEYNEKDNSKKITFVVEEDSFAFKLPLEGGHNWTCTQGAGGPTHKNSNNQFYSLDLWRSEFAATAYIPVYAIHGGKVDRAAYDNANGNNVRIDYDEDGNANTGLYTIYLHLRETPLVRRGDVIPAGTLIGYMGRTGSVLGADPTHLHITFRFDGDSRYPNEELEQITIEGLKVRDFQEQSSYPSTR